MLTKPPDKIYIALFASTIAIAPKMMEAKIIDAPPI